MRPMQRITYSLATVLLAWLLMQAVHEAGHMLAGLCVGDRIERVVLHPLAISRTDLSPGGNPLVTTAAGPIVGAFAPLLVWVGCSVCRWPARAWLRFFAGFCLISNGAYLGIAVVVPVGDAEVLLHHGAPAWLLGLFGVMTIPAGLWLWHGLRKEFGWGAGARTVTNRETASLLIVLVAVIVIECALSSRM